MTSNELLRRRMQNQRLGKPDFTGPAEVVQWFCAMQAQDFLGALWSVGQRVVKSTEQDIEAAIARRDIVRTWPMRGTLHFVAADDVRWLTSFLAPRVITRAKSIYREQGLDTPVLEQGRKIIERFLEKNGAMTRQQIYDELERNKLAVTGQRGLHFIGYAAQSLSICVGPREGKQHTFVLLDEWIPKSRLLSHDESLLEVTRRYFDARGPATVNDLCWWTGLTQKEALRGIDMAKDQLVNVRIGEQDYFMKDEQAKRSSAASVSLLSWFDEFIIGYKDRSATFDPTAAKFIKVPKNGLYTPVILINGKIAGNWKRSFVKGEVKVEVNLFRKFTPPEKTKLDAEVKKFIRFSQ
jgi:hypothetical protein